MIKVLLILPNGFEIFEGAAFVDVLGWADDCGDTRIEVVKAGVTNELTCTFGGFRVIPDFTLSELDLNGFDAVAIPGGFESAGFYEEAYSEPVQQALRHFNERNAPVASICVGALPVAKSGCLAGKKATTYHLDGGKWRNRLAEMGAQVVDTRIVQDGNIITSSCPETAVHVAFLLLEQLTGKQNADHVRTQMGFGPVE
jgi:protein deglycase